MEIAVIGAGISGLTAATLLTQGGHNVTVYEKARGPGGRTSTRRTETSAVDHGAQYFTVTHPEFEAFLASEIGSDVYAPWQGTTAALTDGGLESTTVAETRYVGVPGMNALCKTMAAKLELKTQHKIIRLVDQGAWYVQDEGNNQHGPYDWVISSCPAPQSFALINTYTDISRVIVDVNTHACFTVFLQPKGDIVLPYDAIACEHNMLGFMANNHSKPGRDGKPFLVIQANHRWADISASMVLQGVEKQLLSAAEKALDIQFGELDYVSTHRWLYAAFPNPLGHRVLIDNEKKIAACGDWCWGNGIEDAFLSGKHTAEALLKSL